MNDLLIADVNFEAIQDDIDNNIVLRDFLPIGIKSLKECCVAAIKNYNEDKIFAKSPDMNKIRSHVVEVLNIGTIRKYNIHGYVSLIIKHRKRVTNFEDELTGPTLMAISHIFGREIADTIFNNEISTDVLLFKKEYSDKQFWRYKLRKFEGTKHWFFLFKYLFVDCYNDDREPSFARTRKGKRQMMIYLSPEWHNRLNELHFFEMIKEPFENIIRCIDLIILSGDVELNPGPAIMSRFVRYNNSSTRHAHEAQVSVLNDISDLNKFLNSQLPIVVEQIRKIVDDCNLGFQSTVLLADSKLKEDIRLLTQASGEAISKVEGIQSMILKTMLLCSLIILLRQMQWNRTALMAGVIGMLSLFGLPGKLIQLFQKAFNHESQNFGVDTVYGPLLGSIICYFIIGKLPTNSSLEQFSKKTNNISRGLSGMMNLNRDIGKLWLQVKDFVMAQISPLPDSFMSVEEELRVWSDSIEHYTDIIVKKQAMIKNVDIIKISGLLKQGIRLKKWAYANKCSTQMCLHIASMCRHAEQLYNFCDKNNTLDGGQRQRPLCIVLFGESQIGKSRLIYPLCQDLCYEAGFRKSTDIEEQIYARQPETEFWDGYKGQFIVVRDDCLAAVDDVSKPNPELHETIRELNDFPYHLHMAALEDKNTYYTSKVGIMTINDINSPIRSLSYPEAFFNRISDHMYEVVPHPDFAKTLDVGGGRTKTLLDQVKVAKHLDALSEIAGYRVPTSTEIYTFQKYKKQIISGKLQFIPDLTQPLLNYDAFSTLMCSELSRKQDDFVIQKDFMNKRLEKKMEAQVNDDIYFECDAFNADDASEFGDVIAKGLHEGRSLLEIETEILESDRAEAYINFKGACQLVSPPISSKLKYYAANIFDDFKLTVCEFFTSCRDKIASILDKYPALKYIFFIGTTAVGLYTVYKAFMQEEIIDSFIVADSIDEETYLRNCKWIKQQTKMSVEENMSYWKTNLMMRNPEECELIDKNTSNIPIHTIEAYNSPGQGKDKKKPRHVIEAYNSPGQGKDKRRAKFVVETRVHESEGTNDVNAIETSMHILRNNLYSLTYESKNGDKLLGNVMALKGFNFLMPYHFIQYMQLMELPLDTKLSLSRINYSEKVYNSMMSFTLSEIIHADGTLNRAVRLIQKEDELDAIIFCPSERSNIVCHRSILKHFILREEQCRLFGKMEGVLLSYNNDNGQIAKLIKTLKNVHSFDTPLPISVLGHEYIQRHGYLYEGNTMKGECGGPLIILANSLIRKIVGMHVSGMAGEGYSVKLNQELLEEHLDALAAKIPDGHRSQCYVHIDESILQSNECDIPPGVFPEIGKVKIPLYQCSKTVLRPSLIHGEITTPITKPAYLRPFMKDGIMIDPAIKGLEKCGGITKLIDPIKCEMARNYIYQKISRDYVDCGYERYARVMTYEEAIMGNEDTFISAMCRSTSPGYPFNSDPQYKTRLPGKQAWMGKAEDFDFTSDKALELRAIVDQLRTDCLNGVITNVICADTMKDERRPIAKVNEGKTRMFSACPMHFVTLFRQYYVGFAAFIMHNRNVNGIAVGTNVYSADWDQIVRQIKLKGNKVLAGDFSNFDGSLITQVLWLVYDIIEEFYKMHDVNYSEDDRKIRYSLWIHIVNSIHIYGDNIYQWTHSQPSGNPFTVIINSVYNLLILCIAYFETVEDSDIPKEEKVKLMNSMAYDKFVSPIVYGDDNILNIHDNIADIFNQITLTKALKRLGHDYTEETKSGEVHKYRKLHEISFLKRNFKFCNDVSHYVAPLDINVIYEMMNWVRGNSVDPVHLLKDNIETALTEASLHGKEVYHAFVAKLKKNNKVVTKVIPFIPTYGELRLRVEQFSPSDGFMA
jgi:hypothetical protein